MKPTKEQIEAYKAMAASAPKAMEGCIRKYLEEHCQKYKGNEDKFDRCMKHLVENILEMLGGRDAAVDNKLSGAIPADTVFRICMDYFDDEVWKAEDEAEAKEKAEQEKREAERKARLAKKKSNVITSSRSDVGKDDDDDDDDKDEIVVPTPPKKKDDGQLDFFAIMGV